MSPIARALAALVALPLSAAASAQFFHAGDIFIEQVDGRLHTNRTLSDTEFEPERVFSSSLFGFGGFAFTDDPGFQSLDLPGFSAVRVDFVDAPRIWDGQDFDALAAAPFFLSRNQVDYPAPTVAGETAEGPALPISEFGDMHSHPGQRFTVPLPDGVYLVQYRLVSNAGIEPSEPVFVLYNWNRPTSEVDAAALYIRENLLTPPCPADFTGDALVGGADLSFMLGEWGAAGGPADLTGDDLVTPADLSLLLGAWGPCPQ